LLLIGFSSAIAALLAALVYGVLATGPAANCEISANGSGRRAVTHLSVDGREEFILA
jgi:hypothetical protein